MKPIRSGQVQQSLIEVLMKDGTTDTATVDWGFRASEYSNKRVSVRVSLGDKSEEQTAFDFYLAFQEARREFESDGCRFLCYGASLNVWPSGMTRDMGMGLKGYKMIEGRDTSMDDLVPIFETGDDVIPSTVDEQYAFVDAWYKSIVKARHRSADRKWWQFWRR